MPATEKALRWAVRGGQISDGYKAQNILLKMSHVEQEFNQIGHKAHGACGQGNLRVI